MSDIRLEALQHLYSKGTPFEKVAIDEINLEIPSTNSSVLSCLDTISSATVL